VQLLTLKKILVATDFDEGSRAALATARSLAEAANAELHVVHVSSDASADASLSSLISELGVNAERHIRGGDAAHAINLLSDEVGADAILLGNYRQRHETSGRRLLGSTAMAVVTNAAVPCLVLTQPLQVPLSRTIVAVDLADSARGTLAVALTWTSALRQQHASHPTALTVLHVTNNPLSADRRDALDDLLAGLRDEAGSWAGTTIERITSEGADAADGIAKYAEEHRANLVVLGTRGLGQESKGRLGSVSARVMQQLDLPVLLVPPAVWAAPPR
jgi:nucleotide-binding universal stress UspA family protein